MTARKTTTRESILRELATLNPIIQGKLCEDRRILANGESRVYYNIQKWANGKNHKINVPDDKVEFYRNALAEGVRAKELLCRLAEIDEREAIENSSCLKKNCGRKSPAGRKKSAK